MKRSIASQSSSEFGRRWHRPAIALVTSTLLFSNPGFSATALPASILVSQRQNTWDAALRTARLVNANQEITALVLQLNVLNKPETTYANAIYQVFARQGGRWKQIYVNTGARLITNTSGRLTLPPEVILLRDLQQQLNDGVDLNDVQLKTVVQLRYDLRGGERNQLAQWERIDSYSAIAQTTVADLTMVTTTTQTPQPIPVNSTIGTRTDLSTDPLKPHRGHFSLAIRQPQVTLPNVIARVTLRPKRADAYLQERFIGDFRYRMNQQARFIRGVNPGDRVVVRLFTPQNVLIGYSEFELLDDNAAVALILPSRTSEFGTVRTVYGLDANEDYAIDSTARVYDYFTQLTRTTDLRLTQVSFLRNTRSINTRLFQIQGFPAPQRDCVYSRSFTTGQFALASRTISIFSTNLASAILALPGSVVQTISLDRNQITTYEVSRLIVNYRQVGISDGTTISVDDDDDRDDSNREETASGRRRHCNQGIGNGSEGCDPGRSRPHGGSNDEP
jgi:hypothetical protein